MFYVCFVIFYICFMRLHNCKNELSYGKGCVIMFDFTDAHIYLSTKEVIKVKPEIIPTKEGHLITVKAEDIPQNAIY